MYPLTYEAGYKREPDRLSTFFRFILVIPWLIVAVIYLIALFFTHIAAWLAILFTGRYPDGLYSFNSGVLRYLVRFIAFSSLQTDRYPPFSIETDPTYPIRLQVTPRAESQSRLKVFFRAILAIPLLVVLQFVQLLQSGASALAWLTIVFRGYQPSGIHNALTFSISWYARLAGYWLLLTDIYPPMAEEASRTGQPALGTSAPAPATPATEQQPLPPEEPSA